MADKRISELTSATSLGDADVFPIVQSGETKKLTGSAVKSYAQSGVVLASEKGANSGVATLGSDGKLTASQLPDLAVSDYLGSVATQSAMLALTGQKGDWAIRSDLGTTWVISGNNPSLLASWTELSYPTAPVTSVAGKTGAVSLVKGDVGLGDVDNTSDANKPISNATQTALDTKQVKVTASGLLKGDGNGGVSAATSGTDYVAPSAVGATIVSQTGANGAAALPSGTTAQRPASPVAGNIRYNASTGKFEGYGSAWGNIGGGAAIGDAAPSNPGAGDLWWNSLDGHLYVYYSDVDTSQWVDAFAGGQGQYLPLTGGTISGNLTVAGSIRQSGAVAGYDAYSATRAGRQFAWGLDASGNWGLWDTTSGANNRILVDANGNFGLGNTPPSGAISNGMYFGSAGSTIGLGNGLQLAGNTYWDGAWKYRVSSIPANRIDINSGSAGAIGFFTAPSGTAGAAASFTQAMTLDASGNLLVATTAPPKSGANTKTKVANSGMGGITFGGTAAADTGIPVNASGGGNTLVLLGSCNYGAGTQTRSAVYILSFYYDGNNMPAVTYVGGTANFLTFGLSGTNTLTVANSSSGNAAVSWFSCAG